MGRVLVLAGLLLAGTALGGDLSSRALLTYRDYDTEGLASDGFNQIYDLRLERQFTDPFRLRLSLRAEKSDLGTNLGLGRVGRDFSQYQPGAEMLYALPQFQLQGNYDLIDTNSSVANGPSNERRVERAFGLGSWRPQRLPGLSFQVERRGVEDVLAEIDRTETLLQGTMDYTWKGLSLSAIRRDRRLDDGGIGFARRSRENQGLLGYEGRFFDGRVSASINGLFSATQLDERAGNEPVSVLTPVVIAHAYHAVDDTPLEDDAQPREVPALVDGNIDRGAGISLGPDGAFYQNFSLDVGRFVTLDTFRVHVRDAEGKLVPLGGLITWDVYVSTDGARWTSVSVGVSGAFVPALSYYEVRFTATPSRYFKLVNFQTNSVATEVTEVQAFSRTEFAAGEMRRTDVRLGSGNATLTVQPMRQVTLTYYGLFNGLEQTSPALDLENRSYEQVASAQLDPTHVLGLTVRYQKRDVTQTGLVFDQAYEAWSGILDLRWLATLQQTLEATRSREDNTGRRIASDGVTLHTYTRFYPSLDLRLDLGLAQETYSGLLAGVLPLGQNVDRRYLNGVGRAQLIEGLTLTLTATVQRAVYENGFTPPDGSGDLLPPEGIALPPERDDRWSAELFYRPGSRLGLSARIGRATAGTLKGMLQRYHVDWYPFAGGALALGGTYDQDVDSIANRQARRLTFTPVWTINRRTILNLNYTRLTAVANRSTTARSFYATLTLTL